LALRPETNGRILLQEGRSMKLKDTYRPDTVTITVGDDQLVGMVSMRNLLAVEAWM
jgi:hypothetical protein